jgi:hypothetical protein
VKYSTLEQQYVLSNGRKVERIDLCIHQGQFSMNIANYPYGELHPLEKVELALWLVEVLANWANPTPEHEEPERSNLLRMDS